MISRQTVRLILVFIACWSLPAAVGNGKPSVEDALKLKPVQEGVPFDMPTSAEIKDCTIKAEKIDGSVAWVIRGPNGKILRQFSDSDNDNRVDTWSYFRDGLEVYRDLDANFNDKADQYRWFHGAGMRWGIDRDENGVIDTWKLISAEEVAEELVEAIRTRDLTRFKRLLLNSVELKQLGLANDLGTKLSKRIESAPASFRKLTSNKQVATDLEFRDFGGLKPGMVPAQSGNTQKDLVVYENVWAMVRKGDDFEQLQLGTLVNVKGAWKLLDCPSFGDPTQVTRGLFFDTNPLAGPTEPSALAAGEAPSEKMQEILGKLEQLDKQLMQADASKKPALNKSRANLLLQLANTSANAEERSQWLRQLADMVSAATQDGSFPGGLSYLKAIEAKLAERNKSDALLAYFEFQRMLAEYYGVTLADPKVDPSKAHAQWLKDLEAFVKAHPKNDNCAEALRQLAMGTEISGENEQAEGWYRQILKNHPSSIHAPMARGAIVRLSSVGRSFPLAGRAVAGGNVDLSKLRGRAVVVQYWTSSSDVCKSDHAVLSNLYKKYGGRRGLEIIGVNLDYSRSEMMSYLKEAQLPWPQLYETGGFESRYAHEMGIVTVPLMLFVGPDGKVIDDNIQAAEIEDAFKKLQTRQARKP
ncbi:MAG: TlpA disulfide reductase family protein [Planctomycetota bacterium]